MRILFLLFVIIPIIEMILLIEVGGLIGVVPTVGLVVLTATIGIWLLRWQGLQTWFRLQARLSRGELPGSELAEGVLLLLGGALLLTPGFFTDTVGFCCLIPITRQWMAATLLARLSPHISNFTLDQSQTGQQDSGRTIDGEYKRDD